MQNAWQAWTFMDFGSKRSVQDGRAEGEGVAAMDCAGVGLGAIRAGGSLPVVMKPWHARTFAAAELASSMTDLKGDAYYGS